MNVIKIVIIFLLFLFSLETAASNNGPKDSYIITDKDRIRIFEEKKKPTTPDQNIDKKNLKESLFSRSAAEQRQLFSQLSRTQRKELLSQLTIEDYNKFLDAYSEVEWKQLLQSLSQKEQRRYPTTIGEQKDTIQTIKDDAQKIRNALFVFTLAADAACPPAMIVHVFELGYVMTYNIHPVVYEETRKRFKEYLIQTFHAIPS